MISAVTHRDIFGGIFGEEGALCASLGMYLKDGVHHLYAGPANSFEELSKQWAGAVDCFLSDPDIAKEVSRWHKI